MPDELVVFCPAPLIQIRNVSTAPKFLHGTLVSL